MRTLTKTILPGWRWLAGWLTFVHLFGRSRTRARAWAPWTGQGTLAMLALAACQMLLPSTASASPCTVSFSTNANTQKPYIFTGADTSNCDPFLIGIAYDSAGDANSSSGPVSYTATSQGGTIAIYNGSVPPSGDPNTNGFVYNPPTNFSGTDTATFYTSNDGVTWIPNGTVSITVISSTPTVTSLSPASGGTSGGTTVSVTGTNFAGTTAVKFGGTNATGFYSQ